MVFLFSGEKSGEQREIAALLRRFGVSVIPFAPGSAFRQTERDDPVTAIFTAGCEPFCGLRLPAAATGVCEEGDRTALQIFKDRYGWYRP